jgi:2-hydroxychromene-2-carboxylate isomerase
VPTLEFFFDYGSPYSYLASTQVEDIARRTNSQLAWRVFLLGGVFKATENVSPINNLCKARYLFKDLQDWTKHYGLPLFAMPGDFPVNSLQADRLGLVAAEKGRISSFSHKLYRAAFAEGKSISDVSVLRGVLIDCEIDPEQALERASSAEIKAALRKNTDEAVERGAFGAPTFFVGDDMYVGNDRLPFVEKALRRGET